LFPCSFSSQKVLVGRSGHLTEIKEGAGQGREGVWPPHSPTGLDQLPGPVSPSSPAVAPTPPIVNMCVFFPPMLVFLCDNYTAHTKTCSLGAFSYKNLQNVSTLYTNLYFRCKFIQKLWEADTWHASLD
jgi:hypothetical protein